MSSIERVVAKMVADAEQADDLHARSRDLLVHAVREGARAGLTQREIAEAIGRSQPEVSRLLRFHGTSAHARRLMACRQPVLQTIRSHGGRNPRLFGSVATGLDTDTSDFDFLISFHDQKSLLEIARLERDLQKILKNAVDVIPEANLREDLRVRILQEAVPL